MRPLSIAGQQWAEYVRLLLPEVHRLLVLLPALVEQNVDDLGVGHVAVTLEALADDSAYGGRGDVEGVEYADFRSLLLRILERSDEEGE